MPPHSRELWAESFWCWVVLRYLRNFDAKMNCSDFGTSELNILKQDYFMLCHIQKCVQHIRYPEKPKQQNKNPRTSVHSAQLWMDCSVLAEATVWTRTLWIRLVPERSVTCAAGPVANTRLLKSNKLRCWNKWRRIGPKIVFVSFSIAWNLFRNLWKDWEDYKACCITRGKALSKPESRTLNPSGDQMFACFVFCFYWWSPLLLCTAWSRQFSQPFCFFQLTF